MKLKTQELTGPALDWAVAFALGAAWAAWRFKEYHSDGEMHYSTSWLHGGPIIERENLSVMPAAGEGWRSYKTHRVDWAQQCYADGPTPLIAAMRCFVASKLGDTADIPEELV